MAKEKTSNRNVYYASTGERAFKEMDDSDREELEERRKQTHSAMRDEAMDEILAHRQGLRKSPEEMHDESVKHFDYAYKDVTSNPALLREVLIERQNAIEKAARTNQVIDWGQKYREIGEEVRKKAGLPYGEERERQQALAEMQESRTGVAPKAA